MRISRTPEAVAAREGKVRHLVAMGWSERQIARRLGCSRSTVWNIKRKLNIGGPA